MTYCFVKGDHWLVPTDFGSVHCAWFETRLTIYIKRVNEWKRTIFKLSTRAKRKDDIILPMFIINAFVSVWMFVILSRYNCWTNLDQTNNNNK